MKSGKGESEHKNFDRVAALRRTELFRDLPDHVIKEAANRTNVKRFRAEEVIFSEHEEASGVYVVVEGQLRSIRQNPKGREQVLSTEGPGAILAAVPVFNGGKFYSTIIADRDSVVLCIKSQDMHQLCQKYTELLWNVARLLAHVVRHHAELVETLALRNVDQRLAQHLVTLAQEQAEQNENSCTLKLQMSQGEIASRIGSTREVVCRAFAHLEKCGLIAAEGKRLTIPDVNALSKFAGSDAPIDEPRLVSELSSEMA